MASLAMAGVALDWSVVREVAPVEPPFTAAFAAHLLGQAGAPRSFNPAADAYRRQDGARPPRFAAEL